MDRLRRDDHWSGQTKLVLLGPHYLEVKLNPQLDSARVAIYAVTYAAKRSVDRRASIKAGRLNPNAAGRANRKLKRRRVGKVVNVCSKLEVARLTKEETLAQGHVQIEERRPGKEVTTGIANLARRRRREHCPLSCGEDEVRARFLNHLAHVGSAPVAVCGRENHITYRKGSAINGEGSTALPDD